MNHQSKPKSPMDKVIDARANLLLKAIFYALIALKQKIIEDRSTDTCYVDGIHFGFNPEFIDSITSNERIGVWVHEMLHLVLMHHLRRGNRDLFLWNQACDYAINPLVLQAGFKMPDGYLYDARFLDMTAEEIYNILLREQQEAQGENSQDSQDNQNDSESQDSGNNQDTDTSDESQDGQGDQEDGQGDQEDDQGDQGSQSEEDQDQGEENQGQNGDQDQQDGQNSGSQDEESEIGETEEDAGQSQDGDDTDGQGDQNSSQGQQDEQESDDGQDEGNDGAQTNEGDDDHSQDQGQDDGSSQDGSNDSGTTSGSGESVDSGSNQKPTPWGEVRDYPGETGRATEDEKKTQEREILMTVAEAARMAEKIGNMPGYLMTLVKDLLEPRISWRDALSRFLDHSIEKGLDWSKPNRRYTGSGIYFPRTNRPHLGEILLVFDTSGSIDYNQFQIMATEVQELVSEFNIDTVVLYADTEVRGSETITKDDVPVDLHPVGGGGTAFSPTFKYIEEHNDEYEPVCIIYMTDGQCTDYPVKEPDIPVLWIITNWRDFKQLREYHPQINPPWGEIVPYED